MPDIGKDLQLAYEEGFHDGYNQALSELNSHKLKTVVRCNECRFAHLTYDGSCKQCEKAIDDDDNMLTLYLPGDFFCGYGERKE